MRTEMPIRAAISSSERPFNLLILNTSARFLGIFAKTELSTGEERIAAIEWVEVSVPFGEKQTVTLSDGTVLHINSGSRLTYPATFSGASRTVFMDGDLLLDKACNETAQTGSIASVDFRKSPHVPIGHGLDEDVFVGLSRKSG